MRGTLRTMNQLDRDMCHQAITRKVSAIAQSCQLQASYDNTLGYPSVKCHPECLNLLTQALPDNVQFVDGRLGMAGEDVAYLINATKDKRGLLFLTGVADKAKPGSCYPLHNPALEGNEDALVIVLQTWLNILSKINHS